MRKLVLAASLTAIAAASTPASAADMDYEREVGLIVSGVVDKWAGVQILDNPLPSNVVLIGFDGEDTIMATGGEGRLSLPLGNNWSVQSDVKYEYNSNALENATSNNALGPRYSYQGAAHFSYRDPGSFLIGVFGGAGGYNASLSAIQTNARFVGGEAQMYFDNITLYVQGGYVNYDAPGFDPGFTLDNGVFARGVLRWFLGNSFIGSDSRLQLEGSYHVAGYGNSFYSDMEAFSVGARYDFDVNLPIAGQTPLFVGYRGTFRDNCAFSSDIGMDDHTIMIGTSYSFAGDRITVDRRGATLDTPNFHSCVAD